MHIIDINTLIRWMTAERSLLLPCLWYIAACRTISQSSLVTFSNAQRSYFGNLGVSFCVCLQTSSSNSDSHIHPT